MLDVSGAVFHWRLEVVAEPVLGSCLSGSIGKIQKPGEVEEPAGAAKMLSRQRKLTLICIG